MKKNSNRQPRARLRTIDTAELAHVSGGMSLGELANSYEEGTGWHEFYAAAAGAQITGYVCTPR